MRYPGIYVKLMDQLREPIEEYQNKVEEMLGQDPIGNYSYYVYGTFLP